MKTGKRGRGPGRPVGTGAFSQTERRALEEAESAKMWQKKPERKTRRSLIEVHSDEKGEGGGEAVDEGEGEGEASEEPAAGQNQEHYPEQEKGEEGGNKREIEDEELGLKKVPTRPRK